MTPERERLVRESWALIAPISDQAARLFYERLFELDPSARELFAHIDMERQGEKFMMMLGSIVASISEAPVLVSGVAALGRRHSGYGISMDQYDSVGAALIWMLERILGDLLTAETREAWVEAYALVAAVMQRTGPRRVEERSA